jgi:hypothetical protein
MEAQVWPDYVHLEVQPFGRAQVCNLCAKGLQSWRPPPPGANVTVRAALPGSSGQFAFLRFGGEGVLR